MQWRTCLGFALSSALLASATYVWADHYAFAKIIFVPDWAKPLPAAWRFPTYVAAVALLPAVAVPRHIVGVLTAAIASIAVGSLGAVMAHWEHWATGKYLFANAASTIGWIVVWHCLPAALVLIGLRAVIDAARSKRG